jgi:small subunit ribosomal protein S20
MVKADMAPLTPKKFAATTSRTSPSTRESPVAMEKNAVLRASRPLRWLELSSGVWGFPSEVWAGTERYTTRPPPGTFPSGFSPMANIHSQVKRNLRTERERVENRRYSSAVKTYFRRLEAAAEAGDAEAAEAEYRALSSRIDRAVRTGVFHRNAGARKKSRAARLRASA